VSRYLGNRAVDGATRSIYVGTQGVDEAEHLSLAFGREIGGVFPLEFVLNLLLCIERDDHQTDAPVCSVRANERIAIDGQREGIGQITVTCRTQTIGDQRTFANALIVEKKNRMTIATVFRMRETDHCVRRVQINGLRRRRRQRIEHGNQVREDNELMCVNIVDPIGDPNEINGRLDRVETKWVDLSPISSSED
jgi:hypothetical protein